MKYIRTKDGIYERVMVVRQVCDGKEVAVIRPDKVEFEPIIKQADTIEELCDEFDWQWNKKEFPYSTARQHDRYSGYGDLARAMREVENYGKYLHQDYEIYGAIWTDKGLVYVAKMNEKGELELL